MQLKKFRLQQISISLSFVSIFMTVGINYLIAAEYVRVDGKTQALFGIKELLQFGYQYYVLLLGIGSLGLGIWSIQSNNTTNQKIATILLSLLAITIIFARIWRLFI